MVCLVCRYFNTSHVVVYLSYPAQMVAELVYFNTSHVVVYHRRSSQERTERVFQYISCCSLSIKKFTKKICHLHFNTSHVVVYLLWSGSNHPLADISIHLMLQFIITIHRICDDIVIFQYISCCSLSYCRRIWIHPTKISIHLMLQFIGTATLYTTFFPDFNTSHVVVYPKYF